MTVRPPKYAGPDGSLSSAPPGPATARTAERALSRPRAAPAQTSLPSAEASDDGAARIRAATDRVRALAPAAPPTSEAPDTGHVCAEVPRADGTTLRVSVHEHEGHPYVRLAVWRRGFDGASWWPVKGRACTVRVRELAAVAEGLAVAAEHAAAPRAPRRTGT